MTVRDRFLIFGHRGSPRRSPENTVESFERALGEGADGFETDLRFLADRSVVLFHDDELDELDIETLSASDVAERSATAQPVRDLAAFAGRTTMILEVKRGNWEEALLEVIGGWPGIVVASFDHELIAELARRKTGIPLGITTFGKTLDVTGYTSRAGATWLFPNHRFVTSGMVTELHAAGVKVVPWTPNRRGDWERLRAAGCDGVITDLPAEAVQWRAES